MAKYRKTKKRRLVVPSWISIEDTDGRQGTYSKNKIRTTKYTFLSFIPKNLFEQFHRFANIYFIFLAALNFVPIINAFQPEVGVIPICLVMSVTAVKDLWEDQRRRLSDRQANNLPCKLYNSKQQSYVERRWADVCVGDVVKLCCNEIIPADMVLLHTSDPKGVCHIETANLDGETNLKQRQVVKDLLQEKQCVSFREHPDKVRVGLHTNNLLLRSCIVRNTETVIGIVVYAGHETKAMQNNSGPRYKRSKLERTLNTDIIWSVVLLLLMCLTSAVAQVIEQYEKQVAGQPDRTLTLRSSSKKSLSCNRSSVSLNTLTATSDTHSPYSTLNYHVAGAFSSAMECAVIPDVKLHDKLRALSFPLCSAIKYDASELSHILDFFLALAVCNTVVVSSPSQPRHVVKTPVARTPLRSLEEMKTLLQKLSRPRFSMSPIESSDSPPANTKRFFSLGRNSHTTPQHTPSNTPSPSPAITPHQQHHIEVSDQNCDEDDNKDDNNEAKEEEEELLYEAESPDEAALVQAARAYGCTLLGRSPEQLLVALPGTGPLTVPLLHLLPFHSARKRMSVVVRHPLTSQVVVYTKGADNVIMELAGTSDQGDCSREIMKRTQRHLDDYAKEGLRTLCVAKRVLQEVEYKAWLSEHVFAETSIENREELILESAQKLETNLTLLGATGIVDRLQEDVPETIEALQRAGIKVWVLTGDKQETAINIACACKLLRPIDQLLTANCDSKEACEARLMELQQEIRILKGRGMPKTDSALPKDEAGITLVIDGHTLDFALQKDLQKVFLDVTISCRSVICCRSTPLQKSQVVRLVGDSLKVMTLAIGDGANDVSMIQVADVGVGISGQEGMQMYVNLLFWFQFFCGFSGSTMSNSWVLIFFNLLFTSAPPLFYGVLDKDVSADTLLSLPQLYKSGQNSRTYADSDIELFSFGSPINGSALLIILLHQVIESNTVTWLHAGVLLGSGIFYYVFVLVYSVTCVTCNSPTNPYGIETKLMSEPLYYCVCVLTTVLALLPRVLCRALSNSICPSNLVKAQKQDKSLTMKYWGSIHRWKKAKSAKDKLNSRLVPQTLNVNTDMPQYANCSSEAGPVPS
ncbi:putative phospholipid-transporting ATPase VD [Bagarius yarrelli]|uniref:P-type phospholipid transporter n=1 Tax=Bagarius yarrelli TaxID=175774 RepID=A0A556V663_BAGYA|nr:putative phospholipid-transporting ATPase VD [Bagarius yarrelli]